MLQIDKKKKLPSDLEINNMWKTISFSRTTIENNKINNFIDLFKSNFSGHIAFDCFNVSEDEIFDWFVSRNRLYDIKFFEHFLSLPIIYETFVLEGTHKNIKYNDFILQNFDFSIGNSLTLDGELASDLLHLGVYKNFNGSAVEAKKYAQEFCYEMFGNRYEEINVYESGKAWNSWFYDFIVDSTYLIFDKRFRKIYLLCLSDVD